MTTVTLHQLSKQYDGQTAAVSDLTLTIPAGKITALLGPSGCGKTTTLKMLAGLLQPTSGDVQFDGRSVLDVPAERRGAVLSFQNHLLFPYMNVLQNVGFGLKMRHIPRPEIYQRVAEILELVQLAGYEKRWPAQLSGGQQQRVALARALVVQPRVLLLDEPLSNLDAHLRDEMRDLILRLQRQLHITTVFVTHDQEEAVILADQIALMFDGRLAQFGLPHDFYERPRTVAIARFFGGINFLPCRAAGHVAWVKGWETAVRTADKNQAGATQLTIRPEHIQLVATAEGENVVHGRVASRLYAGTHTRLRVAVGPHLLELMVLGQTGPAEGAAVSLYLPPEHLCVLAA